MEVEGDSPYDVLGVNHIMSSDNIKKRYDLLYNLLYIYIYIRNNSFWAFFFFTMIFFFFLKTDSTLLPT